MTPTEILLSVLTLGFTIVGYFVGKKRAKLPSEESETTDERQKSSKETKREEVISSPTSNLMARREPILFYKAPTLVGEFESRPQQLKAIVYYIADYCHRNFGVQIVITRILEKIAGSSGVHEAGRAVDIRDDMMNSKGEVISSTFTDEQIQILLTAVNRRYPRTDNLEVLIHHSFQGGPKHLHVQIPVEWA